jgi:hypothetical protein
MEPRDVAPGPIIEPRWLDVDTAAQYLCMSRHSSVAVTEQHYAHLLKEDLVAASQQVKIPVAPRGTGNVVRMPRRRSGTSR